MIEKKQTVSIYFSLEDPEMPEQKDFQELNRALQDMGIEVEVILVEDEMGYRIVFQKLD